MENKNEVIERFGDNDNLIYKKDSNGFEKWYGYDNKGNLIYFKTSDGYEKLYDKDK